MTIASPTARRLCAVALTTAGLVLPSLTAGQQRAADGVALNDEGLPQYSTFSLCAIDPATGQSGASVTTRVPFVGRAVPHVRAGVGAVCTQASTVVEYGPRGLDLLAKGVEPRDVLAQLLANDDQRETRQVGVIDMQGRSAAHTGRQNNAWAGSRQGHNYTVQANIMVGPEVVNAVADTFESTEGTGMALAERMILAMEAGYAKGGDRRWGNLQSAAIKIADPNDPGRGGDYITLAIEVGEHPEPVAELKRIYYTTGRHLGYRGFSRVEGQDVIELKRMLHALDYWRPGPAVFPDPPPSTNTPRMQELRKTDPAQYERVVADSRRATADYNRAYAQYDEETIAAVDRFRADKNLDYQGDAAGLVDSRMIDALRAAYIARRKSAGARAAARNDVRNDLPQPYRTTRDWGQLPPGVKWAAVTAVEPAPDGSIYVIHRCFANSCAGRSEAPILKYDANGRLLKSWGAGMFVFPHGATVDGEGNLWVTDARGENGKGHQVIKFSPDGKVLMTLGRAGVSGTTNDLFDQPTDVVVSPSGDIFVTDSHRNGKNNRVVRFSRDGTFIKAWGRKGSGRGEFSEPHTIAMDSRGRLFVGDRENNRIQIFDQDGTFLDEWRQFGRPSGIFITKDDTIYVADSESGPDTGAHELAGIKKGIRIGSAKDGTVTAFIEDSESSTPDHSGAEGVGVDALGNVYGGVVRRQMLERHVRK